MAVVTYDECCGCATESYPCLGSNCPNRKVPHNICDKCGRDIGHIELHKTDLWGDVCERCFEKYEECEEE